MGEYKVHISTYNRESLEGVLCSGLYYIRPVSLGEDLASRVVLCTPFFPRKFLYALFISPFEHQSLYLENRKPNIRVCSIGRFEYIDWLSVENNILPIVLHPV